MDSLRNNNEARLYLYTRSKCHVLMIIDAIFRRASHRRVIVKSTTLTRKANLFAHYRVNRHHLFFEEILIEYN